MAAPHRRLAIGQQREIDAHPRSRPRPVLLIQGVVQGPAERGIHYMGARHDLPGTDNESDPGRERRPVAEHTDDEPCAVTECHKPARPQRVQWQELFFTDPVLR
jgi:hypothetical protein